MKSKKGLIILACTLLIGCLAFTACGGGDNGGGDHTHSYGTTWEYNDTQHWHECDCGDKKDTANHSFSGDICTVCGYEKDDEGGNTTQKKPVSDYFSGARLTYVNSAIPDTALGGTKDFNTLLDRQLDAVAQELLVRLGKVYGSMDGNAYQVKDGSQDFTGLTVTKENVIVEPDEMDGSTPIYYRKAGSPIANLYGLIDLDDPATYAYLGSTGTYAGILTPSTRVFNLRNAIQGGYTFNGTQFTSTLDTTKKWLMSYEGTFDLNSYVSAHKETVKTGLANALANTSGKTYAEAKASINKLGFTASDKDKINDYVLSGVIGFAAYFIDSASKPTVPTVSSSTQLSDTQHAYKNYEVIVPAIIDSIVNHKLENGNDAYFSADKTVVVEDAQLADSNNDYRQYTSVVLISKGGTPITKMEIKTATNQSGTYSYKVKASMLGMDFDITPTGGFNISSSESTFVLDFEPFLIELANRGGYPENPQLTLGTYVGLIFEPIGTSVPFRVEFTGYWSGN